MKYKIESKQYHIKVADSDATAISTPSTVFEALKEDFNPVQEEMYLLILNTKNKIIDKILISKGGHNSMAITPIEILRPIIMTNGNNFILAHNHPSGDINPSEEDITFTRKLKKAVDLLGLNLLDHVIYTDSDWYSFNKENLL